VVQLCIGEAGRGCWVTLKRLETTLISRATGSLHLVTATHMLEMHAVEYVQRTIDMQDDVLLSASDGSSSLGQSLGAGARFGASLFVETDQV
jgi:hypothetical protein